MAALVQSGVHVIVLLALNDSGIPRYDHHLATELAHLGIPTFACTPDQFPDLMASALCGRTCSPRQMKRLALHFDDTLTQAVCSPYLTKETKKPLLVLLQPEIGFFHELLFTADCIPLPYTPQTNGPASGSGREADVTPQYPPDNIQPVPAGTPVPPAP